MPPFLGFCRAAPRPAARRPGPRKRQRAALTLLSFAIGFVALQVPFHYPLAKLYPQVRDSHLGRKLAQVRSIQNGKPGDRPLVIATGSSLTELAFCPAVMPGQDGSE